MNENKSIMNGRLINMRVIVFIDRFGQVVYAWAHFCRFPDLSVMKSKCYGMCSSNLGIDYDANSY